MANRNNWKEPPSLEERALLKKYIGIGAPLSTCAAAAGLTRNRFEYCLARGRELIKNGLYDDPYAEFVAEIDGVICGFQLKLLDIISESALDDKNVKACMWLYHLRYGSRELAEMKADLAKVAEIAKAQGIKAPTAADIEAAEKRVMGGEGDTVQ